MLKDKKWYDETWNPITGVINTFISKDAEKFCKTFCTDARENIKRLAKEVTPRHYEILFPLESSTRNHYISCPFGTLPTLHRYRIKGKKSPINWRKGRVINVCPYSDVCENGMPEDWLILIDSIMHAANQHKYIVNTQYPKNFKNPNVIMRYSIDFSKYNPEFYDVLNNSNEYLINLIISEKTIDDIMISADKFMPILAKAKLVTFNSKFLTDSEIYNLIKIFDWGQITFFDEGDVDRKGNTIPDFDTSDVFRRDHISICGICKKEHKKADMHTIGHYKKRGEGYKKIGFICEECFDKFNNQFKF